MRKSNATGSKPAERTLFLTPSSKERRVSADAVFVSPEDVARFWSKVQKGNGCWEWTGSVFASVGYGQFSVGGRGGRNVGAHRVSWLIAHGSDPALFILHRCDNRRCVRPDHLFLGTAGDNHADMMSKGRYGFGERHGRARIAASDLADIRRRLDAGELQRVIGRDYGLTQSAISLIKRGLNWRRVA